MNLKSFFHQIHFQQYTDFLKANGTSPATINRKLSSLNSFQEFLIKKGYLSVPSKNTISLTSNPSLPPQKKFLSRYLIFGTLIALILGLGYGLYTQTILKAKQELAYSTATAPVRAGRVLSFQGRLTDTSGNPISSPTDIVFKFYNGGVGGTELYNSGIGPTIIPDENGIFSVVIGKSHGTEIPSSVFSENPDVWLEITADSETMDPRQQIATVAYAVNAETLQGMPPSASGIKNTVLVIGASGNIMLGETSPSIISTSGTFGIEGQAVLIKASDGSGGNITINPDGNGTIRFLTEGTSPNIGGFADFSNNNIAGGNLINSQINNTSRGYNFLSFQNYETGTTNPSTRFSVGASGNVYISNNLNAGGTITFTGLPTGTGSTVVYINSAGNLVSGTLPASTSYTADNGLHLSGSIFGLGGTLTDTNFTNINIGAGSSGLAILGLNNNTQAFVIRQNGNVGIGTPNPSSKLQIQGSGSIDDGLSLYNGSSDWRIYVADATVGRPSFRIGGNSTASYAWQFDWTGHYGNIIKNPWESVGTTQVALAVMGNPDQTGSIFEVIDSANTALFAVNGGGNVGIGTTNPSQALDVNGSVNIGGSLAVGTQIYAPSLTVGTGTSVVYINASTGKLTEGLLGPYDNYNNWGLRTNSGATTPVTSGLAVNFINGVGVSISQVGTSLTINATGTTYAAINGLNLNVSNQFGLGGTLTQANFTNINIGAGSSGLAILGLNNNTQALVILQNGNVGIGTTNPSERLEINGNIYLSGTNPIIYADSTAKINVNGWNVWEMDSSGNQIYRPSMGLGNFLWQNRFSSATYMTIDAANGGNVGIGTTSPTQALDVNGSVNIGGSITVTTNLSAGGTVTFTALPLGTGTTILYINSSGVLTQGTLPASTSYTADNGLHLSGSIFGLGGTLTDTNFTNINIGAGSSGLAILGLNNNTQALVILQNGNVGIKTTSPSSILEIKSASLTGNQIDWPVTIQSSRNGTDTGGGAGIKFLHEVGSSSKWAGIAAYEETTWSNKMGLVFYTNNQLASPIESMRITAAGNVGIGTTDPSQALDVNGSVNIGGSLAVGTQIYAPSLTVGTGTSVVYINASTGQLTEGLLGPYDNYQSWALAASLGTAQVIGSGNTASFLGFNGIGTSISGTDQIKIGLGGTLTQANFTNINIGAGSSGLAILGLNNNTQALVILQNGNVGIGTTNPVNKLQINQSSDVNTAGLTLLNTAVAMSGRLWIDASNNFRIDAGNTATGDISLNGAGSGNVGIGTTAPLANTKLDIVGSHTANYFDSQLHLHTTNDQYGLFMGSHGATYGVISQASYYYSSNKYTSQSATPNGIIFNGGNTYFYNDTGIGVGNTFTPSINLSIGNSGNVGIGTTNPVYRLDVAGDGRVSGNLYLGDLGFYAQSQYKTSVSVGSSGWYKVAEIYGTGGGRGQQKVHIYTTGGATAPRSVTIDWWHDYGSQAGLTVNKDSGASAFWSDARVTDDGVGTTSSYLEVYFTQAIANNLVIGLEYPANFAAGTIYSGALPAGGGTIRAQARLGLFAKNSLFLIDDSGSVGIGTTNPSTILHVNGDITAQKFIDYQGANYFLDPASADTNSSSLSLANAGSIKWNAYNSSGIWKYIADNFYASKIENYPNGLLLATGVGTTDIGGTIDSWNTNLFLAGSGNVGIGTTEPVSPLTIAKAASDTANEVLTITTGKQAGNTVHGVGAGNYMSWRFGDNGNPPNEVGRITVAEDTAIGWANAMIFNTAVAGAILTERMRISSAGNVGIGTASPLHKLEVVGSTTWDDTAKFASTGGDSGIELYTSSTTRNGVLYGAGANFGLLSADASWAIRVSNTDTEIYHPTTMDSTLTVTGMTNTNGGLTQDGNVILNGGDTWLRTTGASGWYSTTYATGMYATVAGRVDIYNGGGLYVPGNVGIGTVPNYLLDVVNASTIQLHLRTDSNATDGTTSAGILLGAISGTNTVQQKSGIFFRRTADYGRGDLLLALNNVRDNSNASISDAVMTLLANGNVGIGTMSPGAKLDVNGTGYFSSGGSTVHLLGNAGDGNSRVWNGTTDYITPFRAGVLSTPIGFSMSLDSHRKFLISNAKVDNNTYVMIGNNMYYDSLTSTQARTASGWLGGSGIIIQTNYLSHAGSIQFVGGNYNNGTMGATTTTNVKMHINTSSGNVGIGTANPLSTLSVGGSGVANTGVYATDTDYAVYAVGGIYGVYGKGGSYGVLGNNTSTGYGVYAQNQGTGYGIYCEANAANKCGGSQAWFNASDRKLKENIVPISGALAKVMNLQGVTYNMKNDPLKTPQMGFIAQDVLPYAPEVVAFDEINDYYGMSAGQLTALLVNAMQEQQAQIASISAQLDDVFITDTGQVAINYNVSDEVLATLGYSGTKNEIEAATYSLTDSAGNAITRVGQYGKLAAAKIETAYLSAKSIIVDNLAAKKIASETIITGDITGTEATFDSATIGSLTADSIGASEASFSTVYADQIINPEGNISEVFATKISDLRDEIKSIIASSSAEATPSAIALESTTWDTSVATESADLVLDNLTLSDSLIIGAQLTVNGHSTLNTANITGTLTVGQIALKDNIIETTAQALYIQPSGLGSVHILNDRLVLSSDGSVTVNGNLNVTGSLIAEMIKAQSVETKDLTAEKINIATSVNASASAVISSPIIAADASPSAEASSSATLVSNATVGTVTLAAGQTEITIANPRLTSNSMVYLTPNGSTGNQVVYIKSKAVVDPNLSPTPSAFTIAIDSPLDNNVDINWWLIN